MRLFVAFCILSISTPVFCDDSGHAVGHTRGHKAVHAPKRLKTKPNLVSEDSWNSALESNVYQGTTYLSPSISYSGANGWDIGVATYNIPVQGGGAQNFEFDTYLGISKTFELNKQTLLVIGTQNGTTLLANSDRRWHSLSYSHLRRDIFSNLNIYVGPYYANANLTSSVNQVGFMTGFELKILPNKIHLTGDYISGHQNVSGAVVDVQYFITPKVQMYIGIVIPETNSGNEFAGVFGFNVSTKDL